MSTVPGHPPACAATARRVARHPPVASGAVLAWMDLEMTGLDTSRHTIVEIATLVTDDQLEVVAEGPDLVVSASDAQLAEMDDVVRAMHTGSGLLDAIAASTTTLDEAAAQTLEFLRTHLPGPGQVPLAGSSIGTDRRFLAAHLPALEEWFHYRIVDVSSVKELCRRWYPAAYAGAPRKHGAHRALDDIRESLAELVYYRATIFRDSPEPGQSVPDQAAPDQAAPDPAAGGRAS